MSSALADTEARERFRREWDRNFAVSANAGSGKTTAISERLAAVALAGDAADRLRKTAVVTYTKKAAIQIGQRARQVLMTRIAERGSTDFTPLDHLSRAFFGTIHSFCLKLAQTYGQTLGINLNPTVITDSDDAWWERFLEEDPMEFGDVAPDQLRAFLRHVPLEQVFPLARAFDAATAGALRRQAPNGDSPEPAVGAYERLLAIPAKGSGAKNVQLSQQRAVAWRAAHAGGAVFLPLFEPVGSTRALLEAAEAWMGPLKRWLADIAATLGAELADRYRAWRFQQGVQTYSDQIDAAMLVLRDQALLNRIRSEGWRVILDEAQDTDPQQFAVLVEITRPPGAVVGTWPTDGGAVPPRPGHFCMVGDGQQAIYGSRADIGNFTRHIAAFSRGDGGELLEFAVTFRAPQAVIACLNGSLPAAFGGEREHNLGLSPAVGAAAPMMQVGYVPLVSGPENVPGAVIRMPLQRPDAGVRGVDEWLESEARQVAGWLALRGPGGVGAKQWGDVAVLAPRNDWLLTARKAFEGAGLEVALQTRNHRCGDNAAYAWLTGLLAVCADPENYFEWVGVLREIFAISDGLIATEMKQQGGRLAWDEPSEHAEPLAAALASVRPFVLTANDPGMPLGVFVSDLVVACRLHEKALRIDPSGSIAGELVRLMAMATENGLQGTSPREWLSQLLDGLDQGRPAGKPSANALSLLTVHSAKGLEWPVVIILGLWRGIGQAPDRGMKLIRDRTGTRVFFDAASVPEDTKVARERERLRELTRLLYVALTRARVALVLPWIEGFGVRQRDNPSFAELWGMDLGQLALPGQVVEALGNVEPAISSDPTTVARKTESRRAADLPPRVLPHQLAHPPDIIRLAGHESADGARLHSISADDAIDYGLWWHETMEFLPWSGDFGAIDSYRKETLLKARTKGFEIRGNEEWENLLSGAPWRNLRDPRWTRLTELGIFAPISSGGWIDGVIDFILHDPAAGQLWIVDWKTNRRRRDESSDALLARLVVEYEPQLSAYGQCVAELFPGNELRLLVYSTAVGEWRDVPNRQ